MAREIEMLIVRKMLIGEDQHRVFRKGILDREVIGRLDRLDHFGPTYMQSAVPALICIRSPRQARPAKASEELQVIAVVARPTDMAQMLAHERRGSLEPSYILG
jgi:hypothetical protein